MVPHSRNWRPHSGRRREQGSSVKSNDGSRVAAELQAAFARLDALIARGVAAAQAHFATGDPYRGLHIDAQEVQRLLDLPAGESILATGVAPERPLGSGMATLRRLETRLGLSSFDLDVVLIALAPEFDLRYERLYAYLQDDVTRRLPRVDLALSLLCATAEDRLAKRARFLPDAPLVRHRIVGLVAEDEAAAGPMLAHGMELDEQVVGWMLGRDDLHPSLQPWCRLETPAADDARRTWPDAVRHALEALTREGTPAGAPPIVHVQGPSGIGKRALAHRIARERGCEVLEVDVARRPESALGPEPAAALVAREALLRQAVVLLLDGDGSTASRAADAALALVDRLAGEGVFVVVAGAAPWLAHRRLPAKVMALRLEMPGVEARAAAWKTALEAAALNPSSSEIRTLAGRFRLTPGRIASAVEHACAHTRLRSGAQPARAQQLEVPQLEVLMEAARAQAGRGGAARLERLARRLPRRHRWADLALPADAQAQLHELCDQVVHRTTVFDAWGFDARLSSGKGVSALFCGPPGTGKTMAAEVIAAELGLDIYKIDLSHIVDKYIGETEKNLDAVFTAAEDANAILFFDEADALFGKRSEVKDAHDRHANVEVAYLLQKMDEYEGVALLATNLRHHLDDAFVRRMQAIVEFPFPDEAQRLRIWRLSFPAGAPLEADVDLSALARDVPLAGGHIKNIALAAAFLAASDGRPIGRSHVLHAVRREYQKLGRTWSDPSWAQAAASAERGARPLGEARAA